ncbi:MAG: FHA domain-containing protein, partial [Deltaproteobacteria bacterium]|nr:FHA domain-containing protein [Deltaproteobacteria bacterium]
ALYGGDPDRTVNYLLRHLTAETTFEGAARLRHSRALGDPRLFHLVREWGRRPEQEWQDLVWDGIFYNLSLKGRGLLVLDSAVPREFHLKSVISHIPDDPGVLRQAAREGWGYRLVARSIETNGGDETEKTRQLRSRLSVESDLRGPRPAGGEVVRLIPVGGGAGLEMTGKREIEVGREGRDLSVPDPHLSRRHFRLFRKGDKWMIEDLGSKNGLLVDAASESGAKRIDKPAIVSRGDIIVAGRQRWIFD